MSGSGFVRALSSLTNGMIDTRSLPRYNKGTSVQASSDIVDLLGSFLSWHGRPGTPRETKVDEVLAGKNAVPRFTNEFWTAAQRQGSTIHEISYRACFKPQLPGFFIEHLTTPGDIVYDPFSGRGTTIIEAALQERKAISNDANPLSIILTRPRLFIPSPDDVRSRLEDICDGPGLPADIDVSMFFHPHTESQIVALRSYLSRRTADGLEDLVDSWCRMVATNRLTGHSKGFFSVYTLPPNQAVSPESQVKINQKRQQVPEYRDVPGLILKKTKSLLRTIGPHEIEVLKEAGRTAVFLTGDAADTREIMSGSVQLTVTSPPFLDIVQYARDNWMRCWFNHIDPERVGQTVTMARTVTEWTKVMGTVFDELYRVAAPGGFVAFEVGEIRNRKVRLDEHIIPLGIRSGFECTGVVVNDQRFTKTSNIWGVGNNTRGTNTNRIVLFRKE